jgi:glutathione synthase/RimK-type ligase-like ATP-grasp enzyme
MNDLVYDVLKREADEIGKTACKDLGLDFYGIEILEYTYRGSLHIAVEYRSEGKILSFKLEETKNGELIY